MTVTSVVGLSDYAKYKADEAIAFFVSIMKQAIFFIESKRCAKLYFTDSCSNWLIKHKNRPIMNNKNSIFQQITIYKCLNKCIDKLLSN